MSRLLRNWIQLLQPDIVVEGTVVNIAVPPLKARGLNGLILDIDDTLVPLKSQEVSAEVIAWLQVMNEEFSLWLVSNNWSRSRISAIATTLKVPYINRAAKPSRRALRRALTAMDLAPEQVAIVGDRLFTDVLAGNRLGLTTILVDPYRPDESTPLVWSPERALSHLWGINLKKTL